MKALATIPLLLISLSVQAQVTPIVEPYTVEKNLANIVNYDYFTRAVKTYTRSEFSLSEEQKEKLVRNGFVVEPSNAEQFFHVYESTHYGMKPRIPNFITTDVSLQLYHLFYDFTLRVIEFEELLPALGKLTSEMYEISHVLEYEITDPKLKSACLKNVHFFGVAVNLLEIEMPMPPPEDPEIKRELAKIEEHSGRENSDIFPYQHDYTQYIPRGHYTRSKDFEKFFKAMMWCGTNAFPFEFEGRRTEQQILQSLLITFILYNYHADGQPLIHLWDKINSITSLYVGATDDLNAHHFRSLMIDVYGENAELEDLADEEKLDQAYKKSADLPQPRIVPQSEGIPSGLQFRFMGQRFIPDSYIMQKLVLWPVRPWPKGLDVMAVLGSSRAEYFLDEIYKEPMKWDKYLPNREELTEEFAKLDEEDWYENLFYGWLYVLKALLEERGPGYPSFMQNNAWTEKELTTALASWAELRHDTILYGKPSMAEGGNGADTLMQPKGYVEPNPEFYRRLLKLVRMNRQILKDKDFLPERVAKLFDRYENILSFFKDVSEKELSNTALSFKEYDRIRCFGREIEWLSLKLVELDRSLPIFARESGKEIKHGHYPLRGWYEVTGPDRDLACIADVHTSEGNCLEVAVGHVNQIYVIVPIEGELHLTRGGVFSYYEFQYPADHRLTDEAWQEMIKRGRAPAPSMWTSSFIAE